MYKEVFNFTSRPFTAAPYVKHYFASESMHQTLTKAQDCIERSAGPVVAVGGPGTGKSLLLGMLEEKYRSRFSVANLTCIRLQERADLLKSILFTLDQPHQGMSEGDLRFALINYLKPNDQCPNGVLLLVDDAQTLGPGLLDEIRLITNFVRDGQPRVRLVLAGTQTLEENLASPKLQSLNQRIAARCYLTSMRREETANYIVEHIERAGGPGRALFDSKSLKTVHEVSDGVPRLVNQVCEHALIVAATRGATEVTENHVREAWDDVQGIPGDWSAPANSQQDTSALQDDDGWTVIEFGQLDDESDQNADVYDFENSEGQSSDVDDAPKQEPVSKAVDKPIDSEQSKSKSADSEPSDPAPAESSSRPVAKFQTSPQPAPQVIPVPLAQPKAVTQLTSTPPTPPTPPPTPTAEPKTQIQQPAPEAAAKPTVEQTAAANGVQLRKPVETVDPFEESFAEEEHLQDRFAPVVAHQNQASLGVTSADLESIRPAQESAPQTKPQLQVQGNQSGQSVSPTQATAAVQVAGMTSPAPRQKPQPTEPATKATENSNLASAPKSPNNRDDLGENAQEIERQAEEILERLKLSTVSHETDDAPKASVPTTSNIAEEKGSRELDESQKVLEEILSQKSLLEGVRNQTAQPASQSGSKSTPADPVNLEYPVAQPGTGEEPRRDDSEMLIVSRMEQKMESPKKSSRPDPIAFPETPVSKGKAQRMDYQKLFDQLRDISRDQV